jgi:hypothetical protein
MSFLLSKLDHRISDDVEPRSFPTAQTAAPFAQLSNRDIRGGGGPVIAARRPPAARSLGVHRILRLQTAPTAFHIYRNTK